MKNVFIISLVLLFTGLSSVAQKSYPFDKWTTKDSVMANTAKNISYMSELEKQIIFYCNLARLNPKLFAKTYYAKYMETTKKTTYTNSLLSELTKNINFKRPMLNPDTSLKRMSNIHLIYTIKKGNISHDLYKERIRNLKDKYISVSENCGLGRKSSLDITFQYLIDDRVSLLGHRYNILNKNFNSVGVSVSDNYKGVFTGCYSIMDFGQKID